MTLSPAKQLARRLAALSASQPDAGAINASIAAKQATLESGTSIKTVNGSSLLGSGDLVVSGAGAVAGSATLSLSAAAYELEQTITATGVTGLSRVFLSLQSGSDADENTSDMLDLVALSGAPATDQITITATFREPTSGPVLIYWSAA